MATQKNTPKIPGSWEQNAPRFRHKDVDSLQEFLDKMDRLMFAAKTEEADKNACLVEYADSRARREWMTYTSYLKGTHEEFLKDVIDHYPSVRDSEKGSIAILNKALKAFRDGEIRTEDQEELMDLVRPVQLEVKKLVPDQLTHKSAVAKFMDKLAPEFQAKIWNRLDMDKVARDLIPVDPTDAVAVAARAARIKAREKDRYLFEDVVTVAREISQDYAFKGEYSSGDVATSATESYKVVKTEPSSYKLDMEKQNSVMMAAFEGKFQQWTQNQAKANEENWVRLDQFMKTRAPAQIEQRGVTMDSTARTQQGYGRPVIQNDMCHYCRFTGHYIMNCEHRKRHIEEGKLKVMNGKDFLRDGAPLFNPKDGRSKMTMVEELSRRAAQNFGATVFSYSEFHEKLDYDSRGDEDRTVQIAEMTHQRQLVQSQFQDGAIQLAQIVPGAVQPAPMAAQLPNIVALENQMVQVVATLVQIQQVQQQLIVQTRGNPNRTAPAPAQPEGF
jgi:hypothetical protein